MNQNEFILCPICGGKTRTKIRPNTRAENLIVFCPKCKRESVVDIGARAEEREMRYSENDLKEFKETVRPVVEWRLATQTGHL